ncbi:MAG: hypothetical protein FWC39_12705, partial [Bacteroidetes bacterium]|nr:hypothetical protein [Bacteroidota bacterium]
MKRTLFSGFLTVAMCATGFAQVKVDNYSNLGVGTTIPSQKLHVVGNSYVTGNSYVNGNCGVGTTAPSQRLHVVGNSYLNGNGYCSGNLGLGTTTTPSQRLYVNGDSYFTNDVGIGIAPSGLFKLHVYGGLKIGNGTSTNDRALGVLYFGDAYHVSLGEFEFDNRLSFKASSFNFTEGYLGVGVPANATLQTKFQIGDIWTFYDGTGDKEICRNARYASMQYWRIKTGASSLMSFDADGNILFKTAPSGTSGTAITNWNNVIIKSNGSVGIGTTAPSSSYKLQVQGDSFLTGTVRIGVNNWTGFLFDYLTFDNLGRPVLYPDNNW